ncbi:MAG: prolipoprotein diacylglyceryl transferase [Clostridia bacterium]|nr:prolipoprotein diacylglyceryl transferase [Clostridia bacterium]
MNKGNGPISFPGLGIGKFNIDNVAFSIGGFEIYWYAVLIATGFVLAVLLGLALAKKKGIKQDDVLDGIIWITPVSVICARLYYVIFDPNGSYNSIKEVFAIRDGGMAIYGAVIGAFICAVIHCKIKKIKISDAADMVAPCFLVGQIVGRWGNFVNQEAFGGETTLPWGMQLIINGKETIVHPTFLYESLWNLAGLIILLTLFKYSKKYSGIIFSGYLIWYGIGRFFIEQLRTDQLKVFSVPVSVLVSAVAVLAGIVLVILIIRKKKGENNGTDN